MATYFMFGRYSLDGMKGISARRTAKTLELIKKNGGEFKAGYALLGDSFTTAPAISIEEFDTLMS